MNMKITFTKKSVAKKSELDGFELDGTTLIRCNLNDTKIVVPEGITVIGKSAFENCIAEEIVLPDRLESIGDSAFSECNYLKKVNIPKTVKTIGSYAFYRCRNLKTIELPESITEISEFCFFKSGLESINIPSSIEMIRKRAFANSNIESIVIPESVKILGDNMFSYCENLKNIEIKGQNITIPMGFCENSQNIESFDFSNVHAVHSKAFYGCTKLHLTTIPENITYVGKRAFANIDAIDDLKIANTAAFASAGKAFSESSVKSVILNMNAFPSIAIPYAMFKNCRQLRSVSFTGNTDALFRIEKSAFCNTDIRKITIPDQTYIINDYAFAGCKNLKMVKLSNQLGWIYSNVFSHCINLKEIDIPDSVKYIGESCFKLCRNLKRIKWPSKITAVPQDCFCRCTSLETFDAEEIKTVEYGAFLECESLTSFNFSSVELLEKNSFARSGIKNVTLSEKFHIVPGDCDAQSAFYNCMNLTSVDLKRCTKLDTISTTMFMNCKNLKSISLSESIISFKSFCFYNTEIKEIYFSKKTKDINEKAFSNLVLDKITFSPDIDIDDIYIHNKAFYHSSIEELAISEDLYNKFRKVWDQIN